MRRKRGWTVATGVFVATVLWSASAWALGGYTLEFQSVGEGGGWSASASFEAEQKITFVGAAAVGQSARYEVTSVFEESQAQPPSSIRLWMLY